MKHSAYLEMKMVHHKKKKKYLLLCPDQLLCVDGKLLIQYFLQLKLDTTKD